MTVLQLKTDAFQPSEAKPKRKRNDMTKKKEGLWKNGEVPSADHLMKLYLSGRKISVTDIERLVDDHIAEIEDLQEVLATADAPLESRKLQKWKDLLGDDFPTYADAVEQLVLQQLSPKKVALLPNKSQLVSDFKLLPSVARFLYDACVDLFLAPSSQ